MNRRNVAMCLRPVLATLAATAALHLPTYTQSQEATVTGILPYPTETRTLENGLKIIVMRMPSDGLIAYWSIVRTGSRDEFEVGRSGFAHFFEHMMFRGTELYPADRYQRIMTELGSDANAYTTDDLTAYHVSMTTADLEQVMILESDRFQNLAYSEPAFQTEAGAVYGEYRKSRTDPFFALYEKMMGTAFTTHTYGHTTLGFEEDIAAMPTLYEYSREFFGRYYRPDNVVLFVAGDVEPATVLALAQKYYGGWHAATSRRRFRRSRSRKRSGALASTTTAKRCRFCGWRTSSAPSIRTIESASRRICSPTLRSVKPARPIGASCSRSR